MLVAIDGDVVAYRSAWSAEKKSQKEALSKVDEIMGEVLSRCTGDFFYTVNDYVVYLTGKGNFRHDVSPIYKANRGDVPKPQYLGLVREYLIDKYNAVVSVGEEADDLLSKTATELKGKCIIASVDKDLLQVPCKHYNISYGTFTDVTPWEGLKFFYSQVLTGDRVDNIIGIHRVGPAKANKALEGCKTELDLYETCVKMYMEKESLSEYEATKRVSTNGKCLWLRRYEGEIWEPLKMIEVTKDE